MKILLLFVLSILEMHASVLDSVTVRVQSPDASHAWTMSFVSGADTAVNAVVHQPNASFRIQKGTTYRFVALRDDSDAVVAGYIGTAGSCPPSLVLIPDGDSIGIDNENINRYNSILARYRSLLLSQLTLGRTGKDADKLLDSLLNISQRMRERMQREIIDPGLRDYGIQHAVESLRPFIVAAQLRTLKFYGILNDTAHRTLDSSRVASTLRGLPELPAFEQLCEAEDVLVFAVNAYITSIKVGVQHHHGTSGVDGMLWARDPAIALAVVGPVYRCALQQQLMYDVWEGWPGFTTSTDSTFLAIVNLASDQSNSVCRYNADFLLKISQALAVETVESITGLGIDESSLTISMHPDSIYVLHFWGTWCGPCMESRDTVNTIATSLDSVGIRTIHIAYQPKSLMKSWKKVVGSASEYNVLVPYSNKGDHIVNRLGIHLVPTYFVIGRNQKILYRFNDHNLIRLNARTALLVPAH